MDPYTISRLNSTRLGGFDQLIVLGEEYINSSMKMMFKNSDLDSPLRSFDLELRGLGTLTGTLYPPEIQLIVDGADFSSLKYYLKFQSGTLNTYTSTNPKDPTMAQYDVTDWVCVFKIAINHAVIPADSPEMDSLKPRVSYEGEFTLAKLWLDSTQASMSDSSLQAESSYGKYEPWSSQPAGVRANWQTFVSQWISNADVDGQTLLGLTVTPVYIEETATFPPTYLSKQTYPYLDPSQSPPPAAQNGNPQNMLLYLMMANNTLPPSPVLLQPGSGMWIDSSHDIKGTYALAGHLFWDSWLLPLLQDFNRQTEFYTQTPDVKVANDTATVYFYWSIGQNPQPDSYFAYQKGMLSVLDKSLGYHWGSTDYDVNNNDQQGSNPPHGTFRAVAEQTGNNSTTIKYTPGSQEIVVSGTGSAWARIDYEGTDTPAWPTYEKISFNLTWSLTLEIVSVDTVGGVQVQIKDYDPSNPSKPYYSLTYNNDTSTLKGTLIKSLTPHYADDVNNMIQQRFTVLFATLQTTLQTKLQNQHKLFLAGQGAFFFKNATFNQEGDFLTQVLYNGTDAPDVSLSHKLVTTPGKDLAAEQAAKAVEEAHALAKSASETASQKIKLATQPKASQAAKVAADFAKAHAKHLAGHAESLAQIHAKGLGQTAGTMVPVNGAN